MTGKGEFFQVDRRAWSRVCALGLNPAVAYLILANGTGGDNRTTSWSTNAIEKYSGIGRGRASAAIAQLITAKAIRQTEGGTRPRYYLEPAHLIPECEGFPPAGKARSVPPYDAEAVAVPDWIWIPNTLVTGASDEIPPVERVRRMQDVRALQMLIELYHAQSLADDGGIHWRQIRRQYKREHLTERGRWIIWGFKTNEKAAAAAFGTGPAFGAFLDRNKWAGDFWPIWDGLANMGLLECIPHLIEADTDEAAIIYPCPLEGGTEIEQRLGLSAAIAAEEMLGETMRHAYGEYNYVVPVIDGFPKVELVGIYRLRYRARTRMTGAWFAQQAEYQKLAEGFDALAANALAGRPLNAGVQHQG